MNTQPPVSVVVTTYRRAHQLTATLDSILAQSFGDFELIISDDASPDETEEICRAYEKRDARVRYRRNPANLNMPGNLNAALREARAPLIANLHDGDVYRPDLIAKWKSALDANPEAALVFNAWELVDEQGVRMGEYHSGFGPTLRPRELIEYMIGRLVGTSPETARTRFENAPPRTRAQRALLSMLGPFDCPIWGTVMARKACYEEAGYFNPRYLFISDVEMWMRLNLRRPLVHIDEPLFSLVPNGPDRPHHYVNWRMERALMGIFEGIIDLAYGDDPVRVARYRKILRKTRDRRWIFLAGSTVRRGRPDLFQQAMALFRAEDSLKLNVAGALGAPLQLLATTRK